jgi:hypothetical protein
VCPFLPAPQINDLYFNMLILAQDFGECPACLANFWTLFCAFTCSPYQVGDLKISVSLFSFLCHHRLVCTVEFTACDPYGISLNQLPRAGSRGSLRTSTPAAHCWSVALPMICTRTLWMVCMQAARARPSMASPLASSGRMQHITLPHFAQYPHFVCSNGKALLDYIAGQSKVEIILYNVTTAPNAFNAPAVPCNLMCPCARCPSACPIANSNVTRCECMH